MPPIMIAPLKSTGRRRRHRRVAFQPLIDDVVIKLLAPEKAGCGLPNDTSLRLVEWRDCDRPIKIICFRDPCCKGLLEQRSEWIRGCFLFRKQSQRNRMCSAGGKPEHVMKCGLCADGCRIDGIRTAADYIFVESILHKSAFVSAVPQATCVTLVLSEKRSRKLANRIGPGMQKEAAQHGMVEQKAISALCNRWLRSYAFVRVSPGPLVAKPGGRQHVQRRCFRPAIGHSDSNKNVVRGCFRVFGEDVEVAVLIKDA